MCLYLFDWATFYKNLDSRAEIDQMFALVFWKIEDIKRLF
jgi:hypothetical protein